MVTEVPIFAHYKQSIKIIIKRNSSDYISSIIFFQLGNDWLLHFVTFFSKNFNLAKCNYKIYNKELSAIIKCFE